MSAPRARLGASARTALGLGFLAAGVAAVDLVRWIRPALLLDPDPSWSASRLALSLAVCAGAVLAGGVVAGGFLLWSRIPAAAEPLQPLPLTASTRAALACAAILLGTALRFAALERVPETLWVDDLSLIRPTLALQGSAADFANATRDAPYGSAKPYGSVGVLYLEAYRASLSIWGSTVFGVRFPSALAGAVSLVTAALLGRALLPAGGGALAALVLAGLRGHLILSRWGWNMIVLAPIVDLATLLLLAARKRRRWPLAAGAGLVAGVGAHVYLSAWPAAAALVVFALWPASPPEATKARVARAAAFAAGFALAALPLFLFHEGRRAPYFARTADHNVLLEIARTKSILPPIAAAADTFAAPWFLADPTPRHDLPGRRRLSVLLGIAVAIAFGRALLRPRDAISGLLLAHAAAVLAAVVLGGQADHPNGSRFGYLGSLAAVSAAAGVLWLVGLVPPTRRRAAAIAAVGALAIGAALGARDALLRWPEHPETFRGFHGQDTWIGRAAARWEPFGSVTIASGLGHSPLALEAIHAYRLDPDPRIREADGAPRLRMRVVAPAVTPDPAERVVERVRDPWGVEWARVLARRDEASLAAGGGLGRRASQRFLADVERGGHDRDHPARVPDAHGPQGRAIDVERDRARRGRRQPVQDGGADVRRDRPPGGCGCRTERGAAPESRTAPRGARRERIAMPPITPRWSWIGVTWPLSQAISMTSQSSQRRIGWRM